MQLTYRHSTAMLVVLALPAMADRYVNIDNATPVAPYTSWATAATDIQTAADVAKSGETIWVTNGHYRLRSTVSITNSLIVRSINGPFDTVVDGQWAGPCFAIANSYSTNSFSGLRIENGFNPDFGGGVSGNGSTTISNCIVVANFSMRDGGGIACCDIYDSIVSNNASFYGNGGGTWSCGTARNCTIKNNRCESGSGGGVSGCSFMDSCTIAENYALMNGGGLSGVGTVQNCLVVGNCAGSGCGGIDGGIVKSCTVCFNSVGYTNWVCGGIRSCEVYNSIVYENSPFDTENNSIVLFSCAPDIQHNRFGNITNAPSFIDVANGDFRLSSQSACVDAGINYYVTMNSDLDRSPRIFNERVDMGAYEFHAEMADSDGDGLCDFAEGRYGTNPNKRDTDEDGFDDNWEIQHGGSPLVPDTTLRSYIESNRSAFGYYTAATVGDLAMGKTLIASSNNAVRVRLNLLTSSDLITWTNAGESVEWTIPAQDKAFFRIRSSSE